jgi:hypothetical protein
MAMSSASWVAVFTGIFAAFIAVFASGAFCKRRKEK